jgi:hypothetical protein
VPILTVTKPTPGATILAAQSFAPYLSFMISGEATGETSITTGKESRVTRISINIDGGEPTFIPGLPQSFTYSYFQYMSISEPDIPISAGSHVLYVTGYIDDVGPLNATIEHTVEVPIFVVAGWDMLAVLYDRTARQMDFVAFDLQGNLILDRTNSFDFDIWTVMVPGQFIATPGPPNSLVYTQIVTYDRSAGIGRLIGFDAAGSVSLYRVTPGWRTTWDLVVAGDFVGNGLKQLLLYDRQAGEADVVGFDGLGAINLDHTNSGWRNSWDIIVAGDFLGYGRTQILLYDRAAGQADIVGFDDNGVVNLDHTNSGWRKTWDVIVVGKFGPPGTPGMQVLLYDRAAGTAHVVGFDQNGAANFAHINSGFGTNWDEIVSIGDVAALSAVVLYDRQAGVGQYVAFYNGAPVLNHANPGWRSTWDIMATYDFQLLLYDRAAGQADVVTFNGATGATSLDRTNSGWRTSWDNIVTLSWTPGATV